MQVSFDSVFELKQDSIQTCFGFKIVMDGKQVWVTFYDNMEENGKSKLQHVRFSTEVWAFLAVI